MDTRRHACIGPRLCLVAERDKNEVTHDASSRLRSEPDAQDRYDEYLADHTTCVCIQSLAQPLYVR